MMLKKLLLMVLLVFSAACFAADKYEVILLGDLHYDSMDIRVKPGKLSASRKRELNRNLKAWEKNIPELLKAAAAYSGKKDVLFTVQIGDITQGDEGSYKFAVTSFERILKIINQDQKKPVYVVRGNHDIRGAGKTKACDEVLGSYMKKQDVVFPLPGKDQTCYKIVGKDLFIFFDSMTESLKAVEKALAAKPDARHIFFVTHIPVMPNRFKPSSINWITGRYSKNGEKIRNLLAKHDVIVLTAHTHLTAYFHWKWQAGSIRQFTSYSIVLDPNAKPSKTSVSAKQYFHNFETLIYPKLKGKDLTALQDFLKDYIGKLDHAVGYYNVAGFNVLRIDGDKVFVDMYSGKMDKVIYTQQIK